MSDNLPVELPADWANEETSEGAGYDFGLKRRSFMQILGAGLLIATSVSPALAQRRGRGGFGGSGVKSIGARVHLGKDGSITVMTGKVEAGQGARAELTQAAAEELRVPIGAMQLVMADTGVVPDDGTTAGSGSSPRTVPAIRQGCAAARRLLVEFAAKRWEVEASTVEVKDGKAVRAGKEPALSYADLAKSEEGVKGLAQAIPQDVVVTPVAEWKVLGTSVPRTNGAAIVTGGHKYPSDIKRPGMLYGKVLRAPSFGAKLISIELAPAKAMKGVVAVRDEQFVGVAAPTAFLAEQALEAMAKTAKWESAPHPSSKELFSYLKEHAQGGVPANPFADEVAKAKHSLRRSYHVPYVQHAPLEPRAAVAEWSDGALTVWTGTQAPFGYRGELAGAFHVADEKVRVIVPDFGAGFGGKHKGEVAVEAARLARAAGRPVSLRWTREEEFTWAYFRPAAVIEAEASLDEKGELTSWHFININAGSSGVESPYRIGKNRSRAIGSSKPLREGSYRALGSTASNFARECFMDELAELAGVKPLEFRSNHLADQRLYAVLLAASLRFVGNTNVGKVPNRGVGIACGTEKGSYVAAEVEVEVVGKVIKVLRVTQAFECGKILNPANLRKQVEGAIIMGLGPALREEMKFEGGKILNASFGAYRPPRFNDVPELDIHLIDRPDLPSAGAGETPIIALAPAIANAVFRATGKRIRSLPIRL